VPAPIGDHALLADGRTAALVDPAGDVVWLCWPRVDSAPCLLRLLDDERGGRFSLRPTDPDARVASRTYLIGSLVLRTVWMVRGLQLVIEEALAWEGAPRLIRTAHCENGAVEVTARFAPAFDAARCPPSLQILPGCVVAASPALTLVVTSTSPWTPAGELEARCIASVTPGAPLVLALSEPEHAESPPARSSIARTQAAWAAMCPTHAVPLSPLAMRTLGEPLARRLLTISACVLVGLRQRNGGIVAAPTTSLPQWPGSSRTWDYRYSWLRDSSLAAIAMTRVGLVGEAADLGGFIGAVAAAGGARALVTVDGSEAPLESALHHLSGYGGARPVRIGNAAAAQPQLDVCGEVLELASALASLDALPDRLRASVPGLAEWAAAHWHEPDHGIWEIRGEPRHYTHSRLLAWFGLGEAASLADRGLVSGDVAAWRRSRGEIAAAILRSSTPEGALQLHERGGGADAGLALVPLLRFLPPADPRTQATLEAITSRLDSGGLVDRYEGQPDRLDHPCGPFLFPTFWTAMALEACGGDGGRLFAKAAAARGSTGLFGEVADPRDGTPLGNYPQVQSHAAFILAATAPNRGARR